MILHVPVHKRVKVLSEAQKNGIDFKSVANNTYEFHCNNDEKLQKFRIVNQLKTPQR